MKVEKHLTSLEKMIEANERIRFLQSNDTTNGYLFNKQLVII